MTIEIGADSGCAVPAIYTCCEREHVIYTIGLIPNPRLEQVAASLLAAARAQRAATGEKVRLTAETRYQAGSWPTERRVIYVANEGSNTVSKL